MNDLLLIELYGTLNNIDKSPLEKCSSLSFHILLYRYIQTLQEKISKCRINYKNCQQGVAFCVLKISTKI